MFLKFITSTLFRFVLFLSGCFVAAPQAQSSASLASGFYPVVQSKF